MFEYDHVWEWRPYPRPGDCSFRGPILLSQEVKDKLVLIELAHIVRELRCIISQNGTVSPIQILDNRVTGETLVWENRLSNSAIKSGLFHPKEILLHDYSELMFFHEFRKRDTRHPRIQYYRET